MSNLHVDVNAGNLGFGLIDHIRALDDRLGKLEMFIESRFPDQGSGSIKYAGPTDWTKTQGAGLTDDTSAHDPNKVPTQAEADAVAAKADAEMATRRAAPIPATSEAAAAYRIEQTPTDFALYRGTVLMGTFQTREEAEKAEAIARG